MAILSFYLRMVMLKRLLLALLFISCASVAQAGKKDKYDAGQPHEMVEEVIHALILGRPKAADPVAEEKAYQKALQEQVNWHWMLDDILQTQGEAGSVTSLPGAEQVKIVNAFRDYVVHDNLPLLRELGKSLRVKATASTDDTVAPRVYLKASQPKKKAVEVEVFLLRGWSDWKISNIAVGKVTLVDLYRDRFAKEIKAGGLQGLASKMEELSR
jgi:ABC-type transporter MlaC component